MKRASAAGHRRRRGADARRTGRARGPRSPGAGGLGQRRCGRDAARRLGAAVPDEPDGRRWCESWAGDVGRSARRGVGPADRSEAVAADHGPNDDGPRTRGRGARAAPDGRTRPQRAAPAGAERADRRRPARAASPTNARQRRGRTRWVCVKAARYFPVVVRVDRPVSSADPVAAQRRNVSLLDAVAHSVNAAGHTGLFSIRRDGEIGALLALNTARGGPDKALGA